MWRLVAVITGTPSLVVGCLLTLGKYSTMSTLRLTVMEGILLLLVTRCGWNLQFLRALKHGHQGGWRRSPQGTQFVLMACQGMCATSETVVVLLCWTKVGSSKMMSCGHFLTMRLLLKGEGRMFLRPRRTPILGVLLRKGKKESLRARRTLLCHALLIEMKARLWETHKPTLPMVERSLMEAWGVHVEFAGRLLGWAVTSHEFFEELEGMWVVSLWLLPCWNFRFLAFLASRIWQQHLAVESGSSMVDVANIYMCCICT